MFSILGRYPLTHVVNALPDLFEDNFNLHSEINRIGTKTPNSVTSLAHTKGVIVSISTPQWVPLDPRNSVAANYLRV